MIIDEVHVPPNSGAAVEVERSQLLHVRAHSIVDLVAFDRSELRHRFDQGRTKANQMKIFISTGDHLISKRNVEMLTIRSDDFDGHHDLQFGMCSRARWDWAIRRGIEEQMYHRPSEEFPDHGCHENLTRALEAYGIPPDDIPSPFNIFQHMEVDGETGRMRYTQKRPDREGHVALLALMDCVVAVSACPDLRVGGGPVDLTIEQPAD